MYIPNAELVTMTLLKEALAFNAIATTLPGADEVAKQGFITVQAVGGSPDIETRMQHSLVQIDAWGYSAGQSLPWAQTFHNAMLVQQAAMNTQNVRILTPAEYYDAYVHVVDVATDFRRVGGDDVYARFSGDLLVHWSFKQE